MDLDNLRAEIVYPGLFGLDHWWTDHHRWMKPALDRPPSFYFKRQPWTTFEDDRAGFAHPRAGRRVSPDVGL